MAVTLIAAYAHWRGKIAGRRHSSLSDRALAEDRAQGEIVALMRSWPVVAVLAKVTDVEARRVFNAFWRGFHGECSR